jgi:formate hydrogenlyase subunit 3/multisubunit Na+/H+ antiporter MnhD subunit
MWMLAPLLVLGAGAFGLYLVACLLTRANGTLAALTAGVYGASLLLLLAHGSDVAAGRYPVWPVGEGEALVFQLEPGAFLLAAVGLSLGLLVAIYSGHYIALDQRYIYYYPLLLSLSAGMMGMVMAVDLFTLYLFTMLASGAAYILVAFRRRTDTAIEAGFKYVVMGSVGAILILAGIGYLLREAEALTMPFSRAYGVWGRLGLAFVLAGFGIKSALVPAHTWLPDAHSRAPSSVSALLSGIIIETNLYALLKAGLGIGWPARTLGLLLIVLSLLNMTVGNSLALVQTYGKRLLGYSSVAQVGYIMMALGLGLTFDRPEIIAAGLFLIVAHAAMKGLAFLAKGAFHFYCDATTLDELRGVGRRLPVASACFVVAVAGLAGVPPLVGFVGRWQTLVGASAGDGFIVWLAVSFLLLNSLLSLGYYLPLVGRVLAPGEGSGGRMAMSAWMLWPIVLLATLVILLGVAPHPIWGLAEAAGRFLLSWRA